LRKSEGKVDTFLWRFASRIFSRLIGRESVPKPIESAINLNVALVDYDGS